MVVKHTLPVTIDHTEHFVANEIKMLCYITSLMSHRSLAKHVYHFSDNQESAITPHGCLMCSGNIGINWLRALIDVLAALKWLHDQNIIHYDVRFDNVKWVGCYAILIYLGESIVVT